MPEIKLLDGKKISFTNSISGFELSKKIIGQKRKFNVLDVQ